MEGRCTVETLTEFGCQVSSQSSSAKVICIGTYEVFTGSNEVLVFSNQDRKLTAVLQFPGPVYDLVQSLDKQLLYGACETGVYSINLSTLLTQDLGSNQSSNPAVLTVPSDWLAVDVGGASSLILIGSTLLILAQRNSTWTFNLYKTPALTQPGACDCKKLTEFFLPSVSAPHHEDIEGNQKIHPGTRPVLICVYSSDDPPPSSSSAPSSSSSPSEVPQSDGHYLLEPVLFKLLFGVDAALTKSPVVVCGLPDGRLCFLPLRPPGSRIRVLHSLEQPVVFVGTSVATETGSEGPLCLVAVGQQGKVVLIQPGQEAQESSGKVTVFTEAYVPGPVVCGCVDKHHLYYSTGSDLLVLDLTGRSAEKTGQGGTDPTLQLEKQNQGDGGKTALQSPISLNLCRVIALAGAVLNSSGTVQLLGLSARGRLQRISLPRMTGDTRASSLPSSQASQRIRDLLTAIGDVCERASILKSTIQSKNQILKHLNQVFNITCLLLANQNKEEQSCPQEKPIRCRVVTSWSRLLQRDSLNLTCVLENSSPYVLERGWTFSVVVFPLSHPLIAEGENSSRTFSFPFHNLKPGEKFEVSLPLISARDTSFPMTVQCSLVFSVKSLLGQEELTGLVTSGDPGTPHGGFHDSCVSFALDTMTLDWLHALLVGKTTTSYNAATSSVADAYNMDAAQVFLSTRRVQTTGCVAGRAEGPLRTEEELYCTSVKVSSQLLSATQVLDLSGVDPGGSIKPPSSVCLALLNWLLSQDPAGDKIVPDGDRITPDSAVVHTLGPGGHTVKITAKECVEEVEGGLTVVEVKVESPSLAAVCGLHHAVLHRFQTLLQKAPEQPGCTMREQALGLRKTLQRAEALLQTMRQSCVLEGFDVCLLRGQMSQTLLSVYQQLREKPLFIL